MKALMRASVRIAVMLPRRTIPITNWMTPTQKATAVAISRDGYFGSVSVSSKDPLIIVEAFMDASISSLKELRRRIGMEQRIEVMENDPMELCGMVPRNMYRRTGKKPV